MAFKKINPLNFDNARLIFRNFSGKPDKFNANGGTRKFGVIIDPNEFNIDALYADGWNVRMLAPNERNEEPLYYLPVKVQFNENGGRKPKIFTIIDGKYTMRDDYGNPESLKEEAVGSLDDAELERVRLVITPSYWEINGKSGIKAYLKTGYFELKQDEFADDYE